MDVLCILGGGLRKDTKGIWHTLNFGEGGDNFGETCDRWRVIAGSLLWKKNPEATIIASGGRGQLEKIAGAPTLAEVIKKELIELGVSEEKIIKEELSNSTCSQLLRLSHIIKEKGIKTVSVISNEWHLERIHAFLEKSLELKESWNGMEANLLSAEEILLNEDKEKWQGIIEKARQSEEIKKRILLEKRGIEAIYSGKYKFR